MLGHPQKAQGGAETPQRIAAYGEVLFGSDVFLPPTKLRRSTGIMPTDEGIERFAFFIHRHAIHAHAGDGDPLDVLRVVQLRDSLFHSLCRTTPDMFRLPDGPLWMLGVRVKLLSGPAAAGNQVTFKIVDHGLQAG